MFNIVKFTTQRFWIELNLLYVVIFLFFLKINILIFKIVELNSEIYKYEWYCNRYIEKPIMIDLY